MPFAPEAIAFLNKDGPKTALITTTINVPTVLELYRACDPDVHFFITGDRKTPDAAVVDFLENIPSHSYYGADWQSKLGYACSDLIGFNTIGRRNIALLEAVKSGAEIIVTIDDDNIPISRTYFSDIEYAMEFPFSGLRTDPNQQWFDPGTLLFPHAKHRGFPHLGFVESWFDPVVNAKVGVVAGLCLGDPDIDATTRLEMSPIVHQANTIGSVGVVVHPKTNTVFNSQNTAFLRELAPAMFFMPGVGRYDDIYASLICQRVMRERDLHVHFGKPFVWQQRNDHSLITDLRAEIDGMENVTKMATLLDSIMLLPDTVVNQCRRIHETLAHADWLPEIATQAAMAFLNDVEKVL